MEVLEALHRLALVLALPGATLLILLPLYIQEMHGSSQLIGIAASVGPLTFAVLRLLGGVATDVFGRRDTFLFGIVIYSLGLLTMALAPNADIVALGGAMCGTGAMVAITSAIVIVADVSPTPEAYGKLSSSLALGGTLGSAVPLVLINYFGLLGFRLSFLIYFLASIYAFRLAKELPETKPKETAVEFEWSWRWALATAIGSLVAFSSGAVTPFFPVFIKEQFGLSPVGVMIAYAPSAAAAIVSPRLAGRGPPEEVALAFDALGSLGSLLIMSESPLVSSLGFSLVTGAVGASSVAQDSMVASSCKRSCGFMVGLYNSVTQIFTGIASLWAGSVYSSSPQTVFSVASVTFALASLTALLAILKGRVSGNPWTGE